MKQPDNRLVVRRLKGADAAAYLKLRLYSLRESPTAFGSSYAEERDRSVDECRKWLEASDQKEIFVGAFEGDRMIGQAALRRERITNHKQRHKGILWGMCVHPRYRGRGAGREIVAELLRAARGMKGLEIIKLAATSTNTTALGLYRRMGFRHYATEPKARLVNGRYYDFKFLALELARKKKPAPNGPIFSVFG